MRTTNSLALAFLVAAPGCGQFPASASPLGTSGGDELDSDADHADSSGEVPTGTDRRVPAEWETQAAVWLQWPRTWESHFEPAFVELVQVASAYQPVHLLAHNSTVQARGEQALAAGGVTQGAITWHVIPNDNAWMRDNGPRYVLVDGEMTIQDWGFDAWGGNFGRDIPYEADDAVPTVVADILGLPLETVDMVHERGDLEFNGAGTVIVSWSVVSDRNPGMSEAEATSILQEAFGVDSVVYIEGFHPDDGTTGHVDGIARFISETEVVVGQLEDPGNDPITAELFDDAALQIASQRPDLTVTRMPFPAGTDYLNWLVGNGYVIAGAFGNPEADAAAQARIEGYFPGRTVAMVDVQAMWADGGGIHCVTNDQPM